jgi:hypothetical protein
MLLSSGDIARAVGRTSGAIRAWERTGKIPKGARPGGHTQRKWEAAEIAPLLARWGYKVPESWGVVASVAA